MGSVTRRARTRAYIQSIRLQYAAQCVPGPTHAPTSPGHQEPSQPPERLVSLILIHISMIYIITYMDRNGPCKSRGSEIILLWIWKE